MFFLQANPQVIEKGSSMLLQYGVLGVFALILLVALWYMEKLRTKREEENKVDKEKMLQRMSVLETKLEDLQDDYMKKLESIVMENTRILARNVDVMEEVKFALKNNK